MTLSTIMLVLFVSILFSVSYQVYKRSITGVMHESLQKTAQESAWHLSNFVDSYLAPLNYLAMDPLMQSMDLTLQIDMIEKQINPNYEALAVVNLDGFAYYLDGSVLDLSDRQYIQTALSGSSNLSDVITSRKTGENVILAAVPIIRDGSVVGALMARLDTERLLAYLSTRGFGDHGEAYIVSELDTTMLMIYDSSADTKYSFVTASEQEGDYEALYELFSSHKGVKYGFGEYIRYGMVYDAYFETITGTHWKVYISASRMAILNRLQRVVLFLLIGVIIFSLFMLVVVWLVVERFTEPILALAQLMDRGSKGDFGVYFKTKSKDEIKQLGDSFNRLMDNMKTLTFFDPVTGLLNRYVMEQDINTLAQKEEDVTFGLVMVQLDSLGTVREQYNQAYGDYLLKIMGKFITQAIQTRGKVYYYENGKIVAVLNGPEPMSFETLLSQAQLIRKGIIKGYHEDCLNGDVLFSVGVYRRHAGNQHEDPIQAVTVATQYAQHHGPNGFQIYDAKVHGLLKTRHMLLGEMDHALNQGAFFLELQPIYDLKTEQITKFEALIRWQHPEKGLLYPGDFIEIAETSDMIRRIDYWVLESACQIIRKWVQSTHAMVPISVNLTAKTFEDFDFLQRVEGCLEAHRIDPKWIEFEITERMVIHHIDASISTLEQLSYKGIKVAIDDFGIGYSSLNYILKLPIDSLKIDRAFVIQMGQSEQGKMIMATIINLCRALDLTVVAEGVETRDAVTMLNELSCDLGQGYYFSKPMALDAAETLLRGELNHVQTDDGYVEGTTIV